MPLFLERLKGRTEGTDAVTPRQVKDVIDGKNNAYPLDELEEKIYLDELSLANENRVSRKRKKDKKRRR